MAGLTSAKFTPLPRSGSAGRTAWVEFLFHRKPSCTSQLDPLREHHLDGLRPCDNGHGSILQKGLDKCTIYLQTAVVVDEAPLLERIHKLTYPCARGTNHLREGCLAHLQGVLRL